MINNFEVNSRRQAVKLLEYMNKKAEEMEGRRKNVPGLIGKLRYKDDTINFIFCEKI